MATNWGPFLSYWGSYCKDVLYTQVVGGQSVHFSEGLLKTLCYETDVGCIPRGIMLDKGNKPIYLNSENWNKKIRGCYWCVDDNTNMKGIFCSKDCIYYFHDWCVERVLHFTKRRFCRLPGCELVASSKSLYCDMTHEGKFDAAFSKGNDYDTLLKSVIRAGPTWYCSNNELSNHSPPKSTHSTQQSSSVTQSDPHAYMTDPHSDKNKNQTKEKPTPIAPIMNFPSELHNAMIYKTDIGIIPRSPPKEHHLSSSYSSSPNWLKQIKGCCWCSNKSKTASGDDNFCTYRCYLIFYEWCVRKVSTFTGVKMCRDTGCNRIAADGFDCCTKEHTKAIEEKYSSVKKIDLDRLCNNVGPNFYKKCDVPNITPEVGTTKTPTQPQQPVTPTPHPQQHISPTHYSPPIPPNCLFSWNLTQFLFHCTDVGAIPRMLISSFPQKDAFPNYNWSAQLDSCYWCYRNPPRIQGTVCSEKCLFLLNEWVHALYTNFANEKLCRVLGCGKQSAHGFNCCNRNHTTQYEQFKRYSHLLKSTEFALGPVWYHDYSMMPIYFYNRDEPFYELTNFYPCQNLLIDYFKWPTTEHYFQANKFVGTPYVHCIRLLQAPRDAFEFSRNPGVQKWVRTNWQVIKINVMFKALKCKFYQDTELAQILIRTRNRPIIEHTRNDKFWGDGGDGTGSNTLGRMLVDVRAMLQKSQQPVPNTIQPVLMNNILHTVCNLNIGYTTTPPQTLPQTSSHNQANQTTPTNYGDIPLVGLISINVVDPITHTPAPSTPMNLHADLIDLTDPGSKVANTTPSTQIQDDSRNLPLAPKQGAQPNSDTGAEPSFKKGEAKHQLGPGYIPPFFHNCPSSPSSPNKCANISDNTSDKSEVANKINPFSEFVVIPKPETTTGSINPFLPPEHSPTNSQTTQAANSNDVTMQDDNTDDVSINFGLSDVKSQQSSAAKTGDGTYPGSNPFSNSLQEVEQMDTSNNAQLNKSS